MLVHAMKAGAAAEPTRTVVVAGHGAALVRAAAKDWDGAAMICVVARANLGSSGGTTVDRPMASRT